jgi:ribosomal protein S18 acetylase RimI-like enzyme
LEKLEKIKSSLLLFKTIFKTVIKEHPELGFGYFKNLDFKISEGKEISETDRAAMISIIEKNYSDLEERKIALAGLEKGLKNKRTVFEILRHKSEIVSFLRFDRIWDQEPPAPDSYFGSFNTNPDFQEASIGDAMIRECLNEEAYLHILEAHTFPDKKITSKYVEEAGFIIEDIELNYMDTGKALFRIRRDDKMNRRYRFRGETKPEDKKFFETVAESGDVSESGNPFLKIEANKISDIITLEKIKTFMQKHNLVITRYFPDDKKNPKYYILAFEVKIPEPEPVAYIV